MLDIKVFGGKAAAERKVRSVREDLELRCLRFYTTFLGNWSVSGERKHMKHTHLSLFLYILQWKERQSFRGNYILVSKSRQQLELKAPKNYSPAYSSLLQRTWVQRFFFISRACVHLSIRMCPCVYYRSAGCTLCLCLHIVCWLIFRSSLSASQNKGNVSNYRGFHLVDALSWLQTWTGVVSYKMYALAPTSFSGSGGVGGILRGF